MYIYYIFIMLKKKMQEQTCEEAENSEIAVFIFILEYQYLAHYNRLTSKVFNTQGKHSDLVNCGCMSDLFCFR